MVIGGFQKLSLIDYPGKVSCVLFLSGCNFRCPYCHNPELVVNPLKGGPSLSEERFYEFLKRRRGLVDGVVISGGEPTLHKDLPLLCERVKELGYPVKLDTNGSRPRMIKELIDHGLVDYIAMDIKSDPSLYTPVITETCDPRWILSSVRTIMEAGIAHEFRTTCVKTIIDESIMRKIARMIEGAALYALQRFRHYRVLNPEYFKETGAGHDEYELLRLKSVLDPWVKECIIR